MTKIIMLFWVLHGSDGITEPQTFEGWRSMSECETAAESLTESNPREQRTHDYAVIATCMEVPK